METYVNIGASEMVEDDRVAQVEEVLQDVLTSVKIKLITKEMIKEELRALRGNGVSEEISYNNYKYFPVKIVDIAVQNIRKKLSEHEHRDSENDICLENETSESDIDHKVDEEIELDDDSIDDFNYDDVEMEREYFKVENNQENVDHDMLLTLNYMYTEIDLTFLRDTIIKFKNDIVKIEEYLKNKIETFTYPTRSNMNEMHKQRLLVQCNKDKSMK